MSKLKKRGMLWRSNARRGETSIEASCFARRIGLTKEEAIAIIKDAAARKSGEQAEVAPKRV